LEDIFQILTIISEDQLKYRVGIEVFSKVTMGEDHHTMVLCLEAQVLKQDATLVNMVPKRFSHQEIIKCQEIHSLSSLRKS